MKRLMLIGPSQCGKTSLTQVLRGETLRYQKTQAIVWTPAAIDTPGEYLENRCLYSALLQRLRGRCHRAGTECRCALVTLFSGAYRSDEPPGHRGDHQSRFSRPAPSATGPGMARGSRRRTYLYHSALTGDGLDDLLACLNAEEYQ